MSSQLYIPKNKHVFDSKPEALAAIDNYKLTDGQTQAVRYKNDNGEIDTFLIIGTPTGINIINDHEAILKHIHDIEQNASDTLSVLVWVEH